MKFPENLEQNMTYQLPWQRCSTAQSTSITVHPASLAKHPQRWTKEEVCVWLRWCSEEYAIEEIPPEKFDLNGKALCLLSRNDFIGRLPKNGDVLYNCLQSLISKNMGSGIIYQSQMAFSTTISETHRPYADARPSLAGLQTESMTTGLILVPSSSTATNLSYPVNRHGSGVSTRGFVSIRPQPNMATSTHSDDVSRLSPSNLRGFSVEGHNETSQIHSNSSILGTEMESMTLYIKPDSLCHSYNPIKVEPSNEHNLDALRHQRSSDCRLLWEFIYQLLLNTNYCGYVSWENKDDYVFRIVNPTGLAELWGQQKNRTNMTYEKLSRALRYYYRMNIIKKVPGKRLTYKFLQSPSSIQKGQRGAKPHCKYSSSIATVGSEQTVSEQNDVLDQTKIDLTSFSASSDELQEVPSDVADDFEDDDEDKTKSMTGINIHAPRIRDNSMLFREVAQDRKEEFEGHANRPPVVNSSLYNHPDMFSHRITPIPVEHRLPERREHCSEFLPKSNIYRQEHRRYETFMPYHSKTGGESQNSLKPYSNYPVLTSPRLDIKHEPGVSHYSPATFNRDNRLQEGFYRSLSCDLTQSLHVSRYNSRPSQTRSASPRTDIQNEPEDLSLKKSIVMENIPVSQHPSQMCVETDVSRSNEPEQDITSGESRSRLFDLNIHEESDIPLLLVNDSTNTDGELSKHSATGKG